MYRPNRPRTYPLCPVARPDLCPLSPQTAARPVALHAESQLNGASTNVRARQRPFTYQHACDHRGHGIAPLAPVHALALRPTDVIQEAGHGPRGGPAGAFSLSPASREQNHKGSALRSEMSNTDVLFQAFTQIQSSETKLLCHKATSARREVGTSTNTDREVPAGSLPGLGHGAHDLLNEHGFYNMSEVPCTSPSPRDERARTDNQRHSLPQRYHSELKGRK